MKNLLRKLRYLNERLTLPSKLILLVVIIYLGVQILQMDILAKGLQILIILISLLFHEIAHGLVAYKLGDNTAKNGGRLSLNPFAHLDFYGTLFPILMILSGSNLVLGWAKPVPINYYNLKHGRVGEFLVAIAGVFANLLLMILGIYIFKHLEFYNYYLQFFLMHLILLNACLIIFNLIPIPPLDGSRILASLGNNNLRGTIFSLDRYGIFIIIILSYFQFFDDYLRWGISNLVQLFS